MARPRLKKGEWGEISTGGLTTGGKIRARVRYCTPTGKVVLVEASADSKGKATRRLHAKIKEWQPEEERTLFRDVATQWVDSLDTAAKPPRPQTIESYRRVIRTTLGPYLGSRTMGGITAPLLNEMFDELYRRQPGNYGPAMTVASGVFKFALSRGIITTANPMAAVSRLTVDTKEIQVLDLDELAALRGNVRAWQNHPRRSQPLLDVVDLALATAARIGELLAAKWEDVDFENKTLTLWSTQVWIKGRGIIDQDETKEKAVLTIHLTRFALAMLEERRAADPEGTYIFATARGTMIARSNLDRAWRAARGETFSWVSWHTFRKSVATLAADATDSATAAKLLGHTSDKVTRKHYIAQNAAAVPDLTAVLEALAGDKATVDSTQD